MFIGYLQRFGITTVLELTGVRGFRHLIHWPKIRHVTKKVLHCFGEQMWGDGLMTPLGYLANNKLLRATDEDLANIGVGTFYDTPTERIYFHSSEVAPTGLPRELARQMIEFNNADEVVRMGRCIKAILNSLSGGLKDVSDAIRKLEEDGRIPSDIRKHMRNVNYERNKVEHKPEYSIQDDDLVKLRTQYKQIKNWAHGARVPLSDECEQV